MSEKKIRIFLAEDNADDRIFFEKALKNVSGDFDLKIFNDGESFIKYFSSGILHPDFIFLDIALPGISGVDCLRHIKTQFPSNDFHVIMLSDDSPQRHAGLCYRLGATAYIQKINQVKLLSRILSYCIHDLKNSAIQEDFVLNKKFLSAEN